VCIRSGKCAHAIQVFKCVSGQVNVLMLYMYSCSVLVKVLYNENCIQK